MRGNLLVLLEALVAPLLPEILEFQVGPTKIN